MSCGNIQSASSSPAQRGCWVNVGDVADGVLHCRCRPQATSVDMSNEWFQPNTSSESDKVAFIAACSHQSNNCKQRATGTKQNDEREACFSMKESNTVSLCLTLSSFTALAERRFIVCYYRQHLSSRGRGGAVERKKPMSHLNPWCTVTCTWQTYSSGQE